MLLEHIGRSETGNRVLAALEKALSSGARTRDLGGSATIEEVTEAVIVRLRSST